MDGTTHERRWFWATLTLSSFTIVAIVFAAWELLENQFFRSVDYVTLHYLYVTRGVASSLLLAFWAAWYVLRQRRRSEEELRQSREHYKSLLEAFPGSVVLYDASMRLVEWSAAAEGLYGYSKAEVLGQTLPLVPSDREDELHEALRKVRRGEPVLDVETLRCHKNGATIDVQLSMLPFRDTTGTDYILEITTDIRERVRLRQRLLEIEKLTSMGKMAAGTAHHLNTPLTAALLRLQMMRERDQQAPHVTDLERLEAALRFCQQFVRRLLEFSRWTPAQKQPEEVSRQIQSVVSFMTPALLAKKANMSLELGEADGKFLFGDNNLLEALFLILLSNALDAIAPGGDIGIHCRRVPPDRIEIRICDSGCGIEPADLPKVFEPFFTTKEPGKGTGLGLAIAHNIVMEHGGSVRLESVPNAGTTAIVELPLHQPDSAPAEVRP